MTTDNDILMDDSKDCYNCHSMEVCKFQGKKYSTYSGCKRWIKKGSIRGGGKE